MSDWEQAYQRQILMNHIAVMAGLKEHMMLQHGSGYAHSSVARFDDAIKECVDLLRSQNA